MLQGIWDLSSPRDRTHASAVEAQSPNLWTAGETPRASDLNYSQS